MSTAIEKPRYTLAAALSDKQAYSDTIAGIDDPAERAVAVRDLAAMQELADRKVDSFAAYLRGLKADIDAQDAEIARLRKRKAAFERRAERLEAYALQAMGEADRYEGALSTLARVNNPKRVEIAEHAELADPIRFFDVKLKISGEAWGEFWDAVHCYSPDADLKAAALKLTRCEREFVPRKADIKRALEAGEELNAARLVQDKRLEVR